MDIQPKSGDDGLRGVKAKSSHQRFGTRQLHKLRNTLDQWLIKPRRDQSTVEVCQTEDTVEVTENDGSQSSSVCDMDEETQPLTPQNQEEDSATASKDSPSSHTETASHKGDGLEREMEMISASSENSVKHNKKITDFFPGASSSSGLPEVRWLGTPISELKRMPACGGTLPPLRDVPTDHTVMIRV